MIQKVHLKKEALDKCSQPVLTNPHLSESSVEAPKELQNISNDPIEERSFLD
jgi:hypothetical protein